jgi:hypothetical protein
MMVAAICIIGICIYFYFWSRKLVREQREEWEQFGRVEERDAIQGIVTQYMVQKKKLYAGYWYTELEIHLYLPEDREKIKVIWKSKLTDHFTVQLEQKQELIAYGKKEQNVFYANRILSQDQTVILK